MGVPPNGGRTPIPYPFPQGKGLFIYAAFALTIANFNRTVKQAAKQHLAMGEAGNGNQDADH